MALNCKMCGTSNDDNLQFCAACGTPLKDGPVSLQNTGNTGTGNARAKTMMFGKAPQIPEPHQEKAQSATSNRTVLGAPAVKLPNAKTAPTPIVKPIPAANVKPASATTPVTQPAPVAGVKSSSAHPAPMVKLTSSSATAPQTASVDTRAKTMLGLPSVDASDLQAAVAAAKEKSAAQVPHSARLKQKVEPVSDTAPPKKENPESNSPAESNHASSTAENKKNALSSENASVQRQPTPFLESPKSPTTDEADEWPDDTPATSHKTNVGLIIAVAAAALVILSLVAFILIKFILFRSPDVQPQILPAPDGEHLTVVLDLPDASPGATVQLQNKNIPVAGGKVQFLLPKKQMALGANIVKLTLTEPGSSPEEISIPITLRHIATNDFSGLANDPPGVVVRFQIADGFAIKVNGSPCPLESSVCNYKLTLPVDAAKGGSIKKLQYTVPFELIDEDGNTDTGQHVISIPITELQLDRPAEGAVVDTKEITVSGSTVPGATVTVNGQVVKATETGFATTVPLPAVGTNNINIRVFAEGSAPISKQIIITKVDDLQPYVQSWAKDLDEKFDFAKLSRNTNAYAGKKIHLTGRIINISTAKGVTAFLMYVDNGCPQGGQCGVYVAFRGETEAGLQSMVDVYGTVRGSQDVDFAGGNKKTLPAIDAKYVLDAKTTSKKKKKN